MYTEIQAYDTPLYLFSFHRTKTLPPTAPPTSSTVPATAPPITALLAPEARSLSRELLCAPSFCVDVDCAVVTVVKRVVVEESLFVDFMVMEIVGVEPAVVMGLFVDCVVLEGVLVDGLVMEIVVVEAVVVEGWVAD